MGHSVTENEREFIEESFKYYRNNKQIFLFDLCRFTIFYILLFYFIIYFQN